ncbi:LysR substrate-binding domain-containing protein [Streptomyces sp. NPDC091272]|uniref:LysR substrate-binding domain-containing protein n=1 Tax=Streptomyces sp. NPDC091272 TaxID=3365981 RepID=UPI0037F4C013
MPDATLTDTPVIRFGYHGSTDIPLDIVRLGAGDAQSVRLSEYDVADPFRGVRSGELDLMIVKFGISEPDLVSSQVLAFDPRAVVVAVDHPLATRTSVSVEELADHDTFARPGTFPDYVWDVVVPPRTPQGRPLRRNRHLTSTQEMMRLVASGDAVHLTVASLADVAPPAVRLVPVHDLPPAPVTVAWLGTAEPPAHVARFVATAEEAATR